MDKHTLYITVYGYTTVYSAYSTLSAHTGICTCMEQVILLKKAIYFYNINSKIILIISELINLTNIMEDQY